MQKIDILQNFKSHINDFIHELNEIDQIKYIKNVESYIDIIFDKIKSEKNGKSERGDKLEKDILQSIENENVILVLLDKIYELLITLSTDPNMNMNTNMNKNTIKIIYEFTKLKKIFSDDYKSIFENAVEILKDAVKTVKAFEDFSLKVRKYVFLWPLYETITQTLMESPIKKDILIINEENKNLILSNAFSNAPEKSKGKSIGIKTYGLIPVTSLLTIDELSLEIFKNPVSKFDQFQKLCKGKKINLISIKKQVNNGVDYKILNLLDYAKSEEYAKSNNSKDGITIDTIERYETIKYLGKKNKTNLSYTIHKSSGDDIIILEEIWPNKYYIMSNKFGETLLKTDDLIEFINFVESNYK